MNPRYQELLAYLRNLQSVAVAYSGGVDSTFLLFAATEALGSQAVGVIGRSPTYPSRELDEAIRLAQQMHARIELIDTNELDKPEFSTNPPTRCHACKSTLFEGIQEVADRLGCTCVLEGSNADDVGDFRPGLEAARQKRVRSPLLELRFTKQEIRDISKELGLPTWNKPAFACLSSRIPYGQNITRPRLARIEAAEDRLRDMGFQQVRVRDYEDMCRLEVPIAQLTAVTAEPVRSEVVRALREAGYTYVCLDLEGYRTGAMNAVLSEGAKRAALTIKGHG